MLEIKPIQDKNEQKTLCELCGVAYRPTALAYSAYDNGAPIGICQFRIADDTGYLYNLCNTDGTDDLEALIIMGRAVLNFIDLCGVHRVVFLSEKVDETLMKAIGFFKNENGIWEVDLTDFFDHPCQRHKKD
jgi:hypothetical protein